MQKKHLKNDYLKNQFEFLGTRKISVEANFHAF